MARMPTPGCPKGYSGGLRPTLEWGVPLAGHMDAGQLGAQPLTVFAASDDVQARQQVIEMSDA